MELQDFIQGADRYHVMVSLHHRAMAYLEVILLVFLVHILQEIVSILEKRVLAIRKNSFISPLYEGRFWFCPLGTA